MEFLAVRWKVVKEHKYYYRLKQSQEDSPIPRNAHEFFQVEIIELAFKKIFMKTLDNQEILIDKEYALCATKLIQQFQIVLNIVKDKV